ncbi:MFS transporter [Rhodoplanes roseus]|nr:MFS transporter [Rhodoplanes roseus]
MPPTDRRDSDGASHAVQQTRRTIGFLNVAHGIDHFVLGIFPTVVIGLEVVYQRPYSELIVLSTAMFVAFGLFSLPAGWIADRFSRRVMMAVFFIGCGLSLVGCAVAPTLPMLAVALFMLGVFAAIYHPVGMAMLIQASNARGRTLAFNGVCGNLGVALASGVTAVLASWLGWRGAFWVPALVCVAIGIAYLAMVADDRHETASRTRVAEIVLPRAAAITFFSLYTIISFCGGLTFNTIVVALPKIVDERLGGGVALAAVGGLATAVFLCGAVAQLVIGRVAEKVAPHILFAVVVAILFAGAAWAVRAEGMLLIAALAVVMAALYGQVTVGDMVIARYTADAWRGRVYAVRYFLSFASSGVAVPVIALLHARGGFDLVLVALVAVSAVFLAAVLGLVAVVTLATPRLHVAADPTPAE